MPTVKDVFAYLCELAPLDMQLGFDNAGFLVGRENAVCRKALISLDVTKDVIEEAISGKYELIISHHPIIFSAIKSVTDEKLLELAENRVAVISMHTNLDIAEGGVNDVLLALIGAEREAYLDEENCGRIGRLPQELPLKDFLEICRDRLHTNGLRYYDSGRCVKRVAVLGGSGGDEVMTAFEKGCDTYLTSDIKYHQFLLAQELGMNLIDGDHFGTEDPVIDTLHEKLTERFPDIAFDRAKHHLQVVKFFC